MFVPVSFWLCVHLVVFSRLHWSVQVLVASLDQSMDAWIWQKSQMQFIKIVNTQYKVIHFLNHIVLQLSCMHHVCLHTQNIPQLLRTNQQSVFRQLIIAWIQNHYYKIQLDTKSKSHSSACCKPLHNYLLFILICY